MLKLDAWNTLLGELWAEHKGLFFASKRDLGRFAEVVALFSAVERIPLLLYAYHRYRALSVCGDLTQANVFERSCYSILISAIFDSGIQPNQTEAIEILRKSYHQCGHGSDVEPPLTLAEQAFRNQPYSNALFDSVVAYRETLRSSKSIAAANVKRKLSWILWHDPRRIEKSCHTRRIQQAIHSMDNQSAFHWQWLLRNAAAGMNSAPGKAWLKEGGKRLALIGEEQFHSRLDNWFTFPQEEVDLSAPGSAMLRLLVWYCALANPERSLPVLARLALVSWKKGQPAAKVESALTWMLHTHGGSGFQSELRRLCTNWREKSQVRKQNELEAREQRERKIDAEIEAQRSLLREKYPRYAEAVARAAARLEARKQAAKSDLNPPL